MQQPRWLMSNLQDDVHAASSHYPDCGGSNRKDRDAAGQGMLSSNNRLHHAHAMHRTPLTIMGEEDG